MRIYNRYVLFLVLAACSINIVLAFLGQDDLISYFIVNLAGFLLITLLFTYFNPRAKKIFNTISIAFFAGFLVIVIVEVVDLISGG